MYDKKYRDFVEAYQKVYEQKIGVPTDNPDATLQKIIDKDPKYGGGKVVPLTPSKSANVQNAHYELEGELIDEDFDIYDEVLECLLSEGYSYQESNQIMVELVNENFFKAVQQRTGIGKPGVGPGQVAKNILRAGISDILGTSIGAGSVPGTSTPVKVPTAKVQSPAPIVKSSTKTPRTSPRGTNISPDPWKGGTTGNRIKDITQKPSTKPTATRTLPATNVRGLLPQGARKILPDPWKQATDTASGARNLWSRVQKATKPQAQLKPTQTNVRGLLPAAKPSSATQSAKPATSVRSQQFQDVQRLNRMTGGGLMGELPSRKPASKPAPKPTGNVDKLPPKPATSTKPASKPKMPGGGSKLLQGLGTLASLRNLTPLGAAAAVMAPRPTADGTLTSAIRRGDVAPPAPKLPPPEKSKLVNKKPISKPEVKTTAKPVSKPVSKPVAKPVAKPVDSDVKKYNELRKSDPAAAKELGMKIWAKKYRPALEPPDIA